jgi:hypothetical protein
MRALQDGSGFYGYLSIEGDPVNINDKVVNEGYASKRPSMGLRGGGDSPLQGSPLQGSAMSLATTNNFGDEGGMGSNNSLNSYMANESGYGRSSSNSPKVMNQSKNKLQYPGKPPQNSIIPPSFNYPPPLMQGKFSPTKGINNFCNVKPTNNSPNQPRYLISILQIIWERIMKGNDMRFTFDLKNALRILKK